jgi:hypothetical protein
LSAAELEKSAPNKIKPVSSRGVTRLFRLFVEANDRNSRRRTLATGAEAGDGDPLSNGAYFKPTTGNAPHEGTVYVVNGVGENAHADGGTLDHPVMVSSFEIEGSMVIDIRGNVLNAHFISLEGAHLDRFRILKGNSAVQIPSGDAETRLILVLLLLGTARMVRRRASNTQTER